MKPGIYYDERDKSSLFIWTVDNYVHYTVLNADYASIIGRTGCVPNDSPILDDNRLYLESPMTYSEFRVTHPEFFI